MFRPTLLLTTLLLLSQAITPAIAAESIPPTQQPVRFERLGLEDGLSQSAILTILQDKRGYLWFGTQDGLNRYDGYSFTIFRHEAGDSHSLTNSSVLALAEDKDGHLWIGTWGGGLNRYDPITQIFTAYTHDPADPASLSDDTVTDVRFTRDGSLWLATLGGLDRFNSDGTFTHYRNDPADPDSLSANNVSVLYEDSKGQLWVGTGFGAAGNGLNRFDPNTNSFVRYQNDPDNIDSLSSNNIGSIFEDSRGTLWVGTGGFSVEGAGLNRLNADGRFTRYQNNPDNPDSLSSDNVMSLWQDADGLMWVGTWGGGLNLFDPYRQPAIFRHIVHDPFDPQSLSHNVVWQVYADRTGIVWLGTVPGGLNKYNPRASQFMLFRHHPDEANSLSMNVIGSFYEDSLGSMWIATWGGGLEYFDRHTGTFSHYRHDPDNKNSLSDDLVMAMLEDSHGTFWVSTINGLNWFNRDTGAFVTVLHKPGDPNTPMSDTVYQMVEDKAGNIWLGNAEGLDRYDYATRHFKHYRHNPADPNSINSNSVVGLYLDNDGALWIGTWGGGISHMDTATGQFTRYENDPHDPTSIGDNSAWAFLQDSKGRLWIGTQRGLDRLNADETFTHYGLKDGLPNETVLGILEDDSGNLWLSTQNGLARFNPETETFKVFDVRDGLQSNEFDSTAYYRDRDGLMYFGGVNGFNIFDPAQIRDNEQQPQVIVTTFRIFNEPLKVDLSGATRLEVPYWQNFIAFEFTALDFSAPQKNQYAYKLEGFDPDWVQAGDRRYASYTNLPGGEYTFRIKAANSDGIWNENGVAIPITITPPIWQNWWFQVGGALMLISTLVVGYTFRIRSVQAQKWTLEVQVSQRTEELRQANKQLQQEVIQRQRAEEALALRAEEELLVSEARFRAMFDSAAVGIGIMGLDRVITDANPEMCRMLGRTREELIGTTPITLTHSDDVAEANNRFAELASGKIDSYQVERRYVRKDGGVFWAQVTMSSVRGPDGLPRFLVGMVIDVDEQRAAQKKLEAQEREYRQHLEERVQERTHELSQANERLQQEIEQRQRVEEALSQKAAEEAVAAERTRLAHDLHDAVTQTLFSASLIAEVLPDLWAIDVAEAHKSTDELRQLTRGALAEMRTLLLELRPAALTQTRFPDLLKQLTEAVIGRTRLPITLHVDGERKLPPEVQVALYRIAQESLNNIVKYARPTQVDVLLSLSTSGVHLEINDNGLGFDLANTRPNSLGLRIMRERAEAIGAEWCINSAPGRGTQVSVTWNDLHGGSQ